MPSAEVCNGADDDCDGLIDNGLAFGPRGPLYELREGRGSAGACTSCWWAWDPVLVPRADGWLALWWLGIDGGREQPNVWSRALGADGAPQGAPQLFSRTEVVLDQVLLLPRTPGGGALLGVSRRLGTQDGPALLTVRGDGSSSFAGLAGFPCRTPDQHTSGRVACASYNTDRVGTGTASFDGGDLSARNIAVPGAVWVSAGAYGERFAALVYTVRGGQRDLLFLALSPRGEPLGAGRPLALTYESYPRLVGTSEGWLVVMPGLRGSPARFATLDPEGNVLTPLTAWPDGHPLDETGLTSVFVHHPTALELAVLRSEPMGTAGARLVVEVLSERGEVLRSWAGPTPNAAPVVSPSIQFSAAGLQLAWHDVAADRTANRVYTQSFGCVP